MYVLVATGALCQETSLPVMFTGQLIARNCLSGIGIDYAWRITATRLPAETC